MKTFTPALLLAAVGLLLCQSPLQAQQKRLSPHETVGAVIDGDRVTIVYGRPYSKDPKTGEIRKIWGGLVPYGEVWRTGADEATLLITEKPIMLGDTTIPAGAYTLWTLPSADGTAKLLVNKQIGQWGIKGHGGPATHDSALDIAQVDLQKEALEKPVNEFTMGVVKPGVIEMKWETTRFSVPFTVVK